MNEPFYCRHPDYIYALRGVPAYRWWTGVTHDDRQVLFSRSGVLVFSRVGDLLSIKSPESYVIPWDAEGTPSDPWLREIGFEECPIRVKRFWVPELFLGIEDCPECLAACMTETAETLAWSGTRPGDLDDWIRCGMYVFHCGCDYHMLPSGDVASS